MTELGGPSSFSTLHFVPEFIQALLDPADIEELKQNDKPKNKRSQSYESSGSFESDQEMSSAPQNCKNSGNNRQNRLLSMNNPYQLRSKKSNSRCVNAKSVSDYETMAFVGLRDIVQVDASELAKLYNYNKREYDTFQAAINNSNVDYTHLIDGDQFKILYHIFSRINDIESWIEICNDLGFDKYFAAVHFKEFYSVVRNLEIRAKDKSQNQLRFFMQLIIYFWDNLTNNDIIDDELDDDENSNFAYFWIKCLSSIVKFISELAVGRKIEVYCLRSSKWINASINKMDEEKKQIHIQFNDGTGNHQYISYFSSQIAPVSFKYGYIPRTKRNNVPCIVSVIDEQLDQIAINHVPGRDIVTHPEIIPTNNSSQRPLINNPPPIQSNPVNNHNKPKQTKTVTMRIPKEGWYYKLPKGQEGPVSIAKVFLACVERKIDQNSLVHHETYCKTTTLSKLPHVIQAFRVHVQKCKRRINASRSTAQARAPQASAATSTAQASLFSTTGRSSNNSSSFRPNASGNVNSCNPVSGDGNYYDNYVRNDPNNCNLFIPTSNDINPFPLNYHFHQ